MTTNNQFSVAVVDWQTHASQLQRVRKQVFVDEQQVPLDEEWDNRDSEAWHILATDNNGEPIGTGRLLRNGQIGRMAVLKAFRGQGLGAAILQCALQCARDNQLSRVFLHAQTHAIPFYGKYGFIAEGDEFMDAGIPHQNMVHKAQI